MYSGCNCNAVIPQNDGGVPEDKGSDRRENQATQIRFITPHEGEIISGQIEIRAEIIDGDGIKSASFWANEKLIGTVYARTPNSSYAAPHYMVEVATSFLPRGILSLTVQAEDNYGEQASKTIQVRTRERWAATFGVGTIKQIQISSERHLYGNLYRSEEDLSRSPQPGVNDKVGSAIVTANAVGSASWMYLGIGEEFSPFLLDDEHNLFFGSRNQNSGESKLLMLGPGNPKWESNVIVKPQWEISIGQWLVDGRPLRWEQWISVHLSYPASGSDPAHSAIVRYTVGQGREVWRYQGDEHNKIQIMRGPYQLNNGGLMFVARKADTQPQDGFFAVVLNRDGEKIWQQNYEQLHLSVAHWHEQNHRLYLGVERREQNEVAIAAMICIDPLKMSECWRSELSKNWMSHIAAGKSHICAIRHVPGGIKELIAIKGSDGEITWRQEYSQHRIAGIYAPDGDTCFVFAVSLDKSSDPEKMQIDRYDGDGKLQWRYEHNQFAPKSDEWFYRKDGNNMLWLLVRNIKDPQEQLGSKLLAFDEQGKRVYLFYDEKRIFQFMDFIAPDSLFVSSKDIRDVRIHHLLAK
jgi:hypothetical protein